ncbi:MAG TPA: hypothetical protein VEQ11_08510 [Chloroflexota bacterium]|nr:hypothetical protein [Chloroflexota bacterium]
MIASTRRQKVMREIMSACADDYVWVWEVPSIVERLLPVEAKASARKVAEATLRDLASRQYVSFHRGSWPDVDPEPIPIDEAVPSLAEDQVWSAKRGARSDIAVTATSAGERFYYGRPG